MLISSWPVVTTVYQLLQDLRNRPYLMKRNASQCGEQDRSASEFGAVERLDRFAAHREEACGRSDVDVRDEQPWFTVWLVAEQRPVGPHHRRSGRRPSACTVYSGEIAGVLGGA